MAIVYEVISLTFNSYKDKQAILNNNRCVYFYEKDMTSCKANCIATQIDPYPCLCDPYCGKKDLQRPLLSDTIKISVVAS